MTDAVYIDDIDRACVALYTVPNPCFMNKWLLCMVPDTPNNYDNDFQTLSVAKYTAKRIIKFNKLFINLNTHRRQKLTLTVPVTTIDALRHFQTNPLRRGLT